MMDVDSLAQALFGGKRAETQEVATDGTTRTYIGRAVSDSEGGTVRVDLGGDVTLPDDLYDEDGNVVAEWDGTGVEVSTSPQVLEGEDVIVTLVGGSATKKPMVTAVAGTGDRQNERINAIEADYVRATELEADVADIGFLKADSAVITDIQADTAKVHDLTAAQLTAATGYVGELQAGSVTAQDIVAGKATVGELAADHVSVSDFEAEQANIDNLQAATADIATIRANSAKVQNLTAAQLEADHAKVGQLDVDQIAADHATIGTLDTTYMHADMANADVAWIQNGTIKDGSIVSAMINDVSANKLTAGTINGSVINVTNLNADNITTGTINGQRIGEGSLSLSKLEDDVYTESEVDAKLATMQAEIDGAIETWTGTAVPTLNNYPASSWQTSAVRDTHVGDVYFVVNSQLQQNGYNYRFTKSGSTYSWQLIKDSDVTNALQRISAAEGKITTFDSDISTLKTDTGTLTTKTTSLETRMSDAESDILDKVDTTTFNEVSDTVDQHSQTISQHTTAISNKADSSTVTAVTNRVSKNEQDISGINTTIGELQDTVESKADGSTVSTISNKLNTVSDTVDGHTQTLTSVQNTLSTKADSSTVSTLTTKVNTIEDTVDGHTQTISGQSTILSNNGLTSSTNITNRVSSVEQDLSGYKTTVSETYATQTALATTNGNVTAAQTAADNAQAAADRANGRQVAYSATSSTGATTAAKVATCTNFPALAAGATVTVRFSAANTSTGAVTLNVNSTGAKTIYVNGAATSSSNQLLWGANANITFTYDGSYWRVDSEPRTWYGTGAVAAATAAKTATINEVVICKGTTVVLNMTYENTNTSATLNVTSTGAKNIYYGTTTTRPTTANGYGWGAGSTVSLTFDGQYWRIGDTTALARLTAAESTISSHTTSISQNASAIALKADSSTTYTKTDVDGLISTEVTNRNAAITAKANEITSSVSETYATKSSVNDKADASDVTALAGRVTTAESNITQNANNIALKVSESDVTGNYLIGKINLDSTTASIAAQHINLQGAVTISDLSSDAQSATLNSNISVGGRNLLYDTSGWSKWAKTAEATEADDVLTCTNTDTSSDHFQRANGWFTPDKADVMDREIVISFDAKKTDSTALSSLVFQMFTTSAAPRSVASGNINEGTRYYCNLSAKSTSKVTILNTSEINATTWTRVSIGFVPSQVFNTSYTEQAYLAVYIGINNTVASAQFRHIKAEYGNVATDWTPAPEDMASSSDSIEFIVGTQTAATNAWTGATKDTALSAGKMIAYYLPYAGTSSAATLNLTLLGGTTTGAKNVKFNSNNSASNNVTTQYGVGSVIYMTYDGTYWRVSAGYYDTGGITNARYRTQNPNAIKAAEAITASHIICGTSSGYKNIAASVTFDLSYPLLYATSAIASGSTGTNNYLTYNGVNVTNNGSITGATSNAMVFLKGTVSGNTFTIAASEFITCTVPNSDDGYAYIPLGILYNGTNGIYFSTSKDLYAYKDGAFGPVSIREASAAAKTATSYVTDITGGGIMVHPSGNQTTGVQVTSDVDILRSGTSVANYGTTARIGTSAGKHVSIDSDSVDLMDGNSSLATFGANETHLGLAGAGKVYMADDRFLLSAETSEGTWDSGSTAIPYTEVKSGFSAQNLGTNYHVYSGLESKLTYDDDGAVTSSDTFIEAEVDSNSGTQLGRSYIELWVDPTYNTAVRVSAESVELLGDEVFYTSPYNSYPLQLGKPVVRSSSKSMTITSTNTWIDGPSVYLDQGQWLVVGVACFNTGSSSGNRKLRAQLRLDTSVYVEGTEVRVATNEYGRVQATAIMTVNSADGLDATLVLSSSMTFTSATTSYVTAVQLA